MESENETRPLLHSFQNETWRSSIRKRCFRIPSEVAITGIILGLFFVVVTLLIVLENMETTKEGDISLDKTLLASPFKFNKKAEDKEWQDKKDNMKTKKYNDKKWDKANKNWKKFPDISGKIDNGGLRKIWYNEDTSEIPVIVNEYGKVEDDKWKLLLSSESSDTNFRKDFDKEASEMTSLLQLSGMKWKNVDDGWKKLSEEGWKDKQIRDALFKVVKERKEKLKENEGVSQSPTTLDQLWDKINDSWKKKVHEGYKEVDHQKMKGKKEADRQKSINDEWKNEMTILQSPKSSFKKLEKSDDGWNRLSEQGWKKKDIEEALFDAWKEKEEKESVLQSPMNLQNLWEKATDFLKNIAQKGLDKQKSQKPINDEWANKFGDIAQSPKSSNEKWKNINELFKKPVKDDHKDKSKGKTGKQNDNFVVSSVDIDDFVEKIIEIIKEHQKNNKDKNADKPGKESEETLQSPMNFEDIVEAIKKHQKDQKDKKTDKPEKENEGILQSPMKFEDFMEDIVEAIKKHQKDQKDKKANKSEKENEGILQSPMKFEDFMEDIVETIKKHQKGNKEVEKQKNINDEWKNDMNVLYSSKTSDQKWKKMDEHWKTVIEHERNSYFGKNDDVGELNTEDGALQSSMSLDNVKWNKIDNGWKKLEEQGWKDDEIKGAVYKAWKDGDKLLQSAMGHNDMKWKKVNDGWKKISNKSMNVPTRCPISKTHRTLLLGSAMSAPRIDCALITEEVRREFGKCIDLSFLPKECKPSWRTKCFSSYKYRKIDGTCNNQIHPTWGKSGTPFVRMIAPDYADGVSALRAAKNGGPLPNPRFLSRKLYSKRKRPDGETTPLFIYFGLIVDHDMVETAVNSDSIPCCEEEYKVNPQSRPKECLQIDIPKDDPFYGPRNVTCLNLVRSIPVNGECAGRREQLNKATAFLDGSVVYGSGMEHAKRLRTFSRGQLRTQLINNTPFMANSEGAGFSCGTPREPLKCFEAGDSRVNMMVELTAMHTLWYREHNRIATELHKLNPKWTDETLFQETKRIVGGELQHITYREFLPSLLGRKAMTQYEVNIDGSKIYDGYDDTVDPSVFNVFGAAAFRFGHSLAPDMQYLLGANNSTLDKISLHETFFNANLLYHKGLDLLLRGAAAQRTYSVDSYITPEIREHLFQPADLDYGYDLAAVGIQRGRDHGLPSYTKWRLVCGLSEVKTWDDLYKLMDNERADMLKNVYQSVEDIDLIPGALAENNQPGSLLGPTYTCLIGRQFKKTRKGDRFWFEIQNEIVSFSRGQLDQIYKSSMARIICDNSDNIKEIQRNPFRVPSAHNPILDCDGIQKVDLSEWISKT